MSRALLGLALVCGVLTFGLQRAVLPPSKINGYYLPVYEAILEGRAGSPWQYRPLAEAGLYLCIEGVVALGGERYVSTHAVFFAVRLAQNLLIFGLLALYYRRLGLGVRAVALGLLSFTFSYAHSFYHSNLQFNTHFDLIFYLLAALFIMTERWAFLPPLMLFAAFNRETSGLIPLMAGLALWRGGTPRQWGAVGGSLVIYGVVFVGLRLFMPPQNAIHPQGVKTGIELLTWNLRQPTTWHYLGWTFHLTPLLALFFWARGGREHRLLWAWLSALVPLWALIHAPFSVWAETRLFLVPLALCITPAALFALWPKTENSVQGGLPGEEDCDS